MTKLYKTTYTFLIDDQYRVEYKGRVLSDALRKLMKEQFVAHKVQLVAMRFSKKQMTMCYERPKASAVQAEIDSKWLDFVSEKQNNE